MTSLREVAYKKYLVGSRKLQILQLSGSVEKSIEIIITMIIKKNLN